MANPQNGSSFRAELFKFTLYKRNQGRLVRQLSAVAVAVLIFFGCYTLSKGPMSGFVNSYLTTTVRYVGESPDAALDQSIESMVGKHGGHLADSEAGGRYRTLTFHFPTSTRWSRDPDLVRDMAEGSQAFVGDVVAKYPKKVQISNPRPQSRRAVGIAIGIPVLLCLVGLWLVFRAINYPRFADFLISVEAEMDKVSWPGRPELYRSTAVVVSTMFLLGFMLLAFDVWWKWFFELIYFLRVPDKVETAAAALFQAGFWS